MFIQTKLIETNKYEEFCNKFAKQDDFKYRVKTAIEALHEIVPLDIQYERKKSTTSSSLRQQADESFHEKKGTTEGLLDAWKTYSKSVAYAENNSRELPLAYANRSVILFRLHKYEECVRDINKALELNYPDSLRANLIRRKAKCLKFLGEPGADDACQEAKKWLENIQLNEGNKKELEKKIQSATEITTQKSQSRNARKSLPNIVRNNRVPCASNAIDLKYDENYGRHIVATHDISVGEVLVIERPYALLLNPDHIYSHCSHCFARSWDSIPCPNCVHAMYCSELCRDEAWKQYHDVECPVKGYFLSMGMNDLAPFSLRLAVLAIREAGSIEKLEEELNNIDDCKDPLEKCLSDGIYRSDVYRPLYCLETHEGKRMWPELISILLNSAIIIYYAYTSTSFFGENSEKNIKNISEDPKILFVTKLIAHHYMTVQINDHGFSEIDRRGRNHNVGAVIYPFCSLFNHSCNPNVTRVPVMENGNRPLQMIIALHPIKTGSQVFDDYGFDFAADSISTRKRRCFPYHFVCECIACTENWPTYGKLASILSTPCSEQKRAKLEKVVEKFSLYQKTVMSADFQFLDSESESILTNLIEIVKTLFNHSSKPNAEFYESGMLLRHAFSMIYGNRLDF